MENPFDLEIEVNGPIGKVTWPQTTVAALHTVGVSESLLRGLWEGKPYVLGDPA